MTEEGWIQKKCKRCGEIFNTAHHPDVEKEFLELVQIPWLPGVHACKDGGTGVAELVGYILDPDQSSGGGGL